MDVLASVLVVAIVAGLALGLVLAVIVIVCRAIGASGRTLSRLDASHDPQLSEQLRGKKPLEALKTALRYMNDHPFRMR